MPLLASALLLPLLLLREAGGRAEGVGGVRAGVRDRQPEPPAELRLVKPLAHGLVFVGFRPIAGRQAGARGTREGTSYARWLQIHGWIRIEIHTTDYVRAGGRSTGRE